MKPDLLPLREDVQAEKLGKAAEVVVPRDQGDAGVETELRDEGVSKARAALLGEDSGTQRSGALPKPAAISTRGRSVRLAATAGGRFGSLRSSVRTAGSIHNWRSCRAFFRNKTSSPATPPRYATQLLVSAAITDHLLALARNAKSAPCPAIAASGHRRAKQLGVAVRCGPFA